MWSESLQTENLVDRVLRFGKNTKFLTGGNSKHETQEFSKTTTQEHLVTAVLKKILFKGALEDLETWNR